MRLDCTTSWQSYWHFIQSSIDKKLQSQVESHYSNLKKIEIAFKLNNGERPKLGTTIDRSSMTPILCIQC
jgi:hypothetical protein